MQTHASKLVRLDLRNWFWLHLPDLALEDSGAPIFELAGAWFLFLRSRLKIKAHGEKVDEFKHADQTEAHEQSKKSSGITF
jgi:hypothetical protein